MGHKTNYPEVYSLLKFKGRPGDQLGASLCTLPDRADSVEKVGRL